MEANLSLPDSNETSKRPDLLIRKWVVVLAETFQFDLPPTKPGLPSLVDNWVLALDDLPVTQIETGFRKLLRTWKPEYGRKFPAPGDLRALVDVPQSVDVDHGAEKAWSTLLDGTMEYFHPDVGWKGPKLDPKIAHAAGLAFGRDWASIVWGASNDQRGWQKKEFMNSYGRCAQLNDWSRPELAPVVHDLLKQAVEQKSLKPGETLESVNLDYLDHLRTGSVGNKPVPEQISATEWEARKVEQKQKLVEYAKEHGLSLENP